MAEEWIVDASPVIVFAKANCLSLIQEMATPLVTDAVGQEILAGPSDDPARIAIESGWGARVPDEPVPLQVAAWKLDAGETSVLACALARPASRAVLDDAAARRCARSVGIRLIGSLGVVLRAKLEGRIVSAAKVLRDLTAAGLYVEESLVRTALTGVGETYP